MPSPTVATFHSIAVITTTSWGATLPLPVGNVLNIYVFLLNCMLYFHFFAFMLLDEYTAQLYS